jgi:hypothetical protein
MMTSSASSSEPVGDLSSAAIPQGCEEIARLIVKAFADAGFGRPQQLAPPWRTRSRNQTSIPKRCQLCRRKALAYFSSTERVGLVEDIV